jgi:hypothetical protein
MVAAMHDQASPGPVGHSSTPRASIALFEMFGCRRGGVSRRYQLAQTPDGGFEIWIEERHGREVCWTRAMTLSEPSADLSTIERLAAELRNDGWTTDGDASAPATGIDTSTRNT